MLAVCMIKQDDGKGQGGAQNKTDPAGSPKIKIKKGVVLIIINEPIVPSMSP